MDNNKSSYFDTVTGFHGFNTMNEVYEKYNNDLEVINIGKMLDFTFKRFNISWSLKDKQYIYEYLLRRIRPNFGFNFDDFVINGCSYDEEKKWVKINHDYINKNLKSF